MQDGLTFVFLAIIILISIAVIEIIKRQKNIKKLRLELVSNWGKKPSDKYYDNDLKSIASFFNNRSNQFRDSHFIIDDITWNDLDMDNVFKRINYTQSTVGEEYLYCLLREPVFDGDILKERNKLISFFQNSPRERLELQYQLARLGKVRSVDITDFLYSDEKPSPLKGRYYKLLAAAFLISPFLIIFNATLGVIVLLAFLSVNMTVYYRTKREIEKNLQSIGYIVNMVGYARKISNLNMEEISSYREVLSTCSKKVINTAFKSFYQLFNSTQDIFIEYIKIILLGELIAYESLLNNIYRHRAELLEIYETLGLLDSTLAIASYRDSLDYYTIPVLNKASGSKNCKQKDSAYQKSSVYIDFKDIYHPLINEPVPNSASICRDVLITGSNASGKSTFLKTTAINAIFAQSICTCLAREYSSSYFMVLSSMALKDNLLANESYFIVEIKSLRRILNSLRKDIPCLCFIDEVLRGTNTVERIAASSEILYHLSLNNCICIAATHDIELASILSHYYDNYHFEERLTDNEIIFDYKIYPGKSNTRNAIKLLKLMGYDESIVNSAEERSLKYLEEGIWNIIN